ncbi:hypothetical protein SARC_16005 [Sphaeroforma arctica JP610]|uniref:Uncharacterized protein n=1 Tax=Sphaeroforma arctica JP610 TaxID=667725 RepID=A0A0L0F403_9EUKA|nr:hypothetical protein SARC_16005 [Sphaeroforma arctica JP610]KNC71455.1 hypothetical protein SARC_16005 [Sphaeroforma arctica JP610]|eukprot:XP_014145357.1 hypothetical protein SARC_16005 [Sphaeroforma arctica JP610]
MATSKTSQAIVESGGESRSFVGAQGNTARALSHGHITPTTLSYSSIHGPNYGTPRRNSVSVSLLSPNPASPPTFMFSSGVETAERTITSISSSALPLYRKEVWLNVSETSPPMQHRKS